MNRRKAYREFLKTEFWINISKFKRSQVGMCESCGSPEHLQCHHKFYRENWFDTRLEDLVVLCRSCHRKEHGITRVRFMICRGDVRFSRFVHWVDRLTSRIITTGKRLKKRERLYLESAVGMDSCMDFHVRNAIKADEKSL